MSSSNTTVRMIELVTNSKANDESLLELMDICTCATAEKYTGVQCVTASMSDVVFEYTPKVGEMLELTGRVVLVGRTSLEIALTVVAKGSFAGDEEVLATRNVCEAFFTYVTTRGPNGEKRFCKSLDDDVEDRQETSTISASKRAELNVIGALENAKWERIMAKYRKILVALEQSAFSSLSSRSIDRTSLERKDGASYEYEFEMTQVVLPPHQNHMNHTFGGVIMSWMAKAAVAAVSRRAQCSMGTLKINSILRINFQTGTDVSNHLLFRPCIRAIFDEGKVAEVEVKVVRRFISSGVETDVNTGYFYISSVNPCAKVFSKLLKIISNTEESILRRRSLETRRHLITNYGSAVKWDKDLQGTAPLLTIFSLLRFAHEDSTSLARWKKFNAKYKFENKLKDSSVHWTTGQSWGRNHTFVIRANATLTTSASISQVLHALRVRRTEWDHRSFMLTILESSDGKGHGIPSDENDVESPIRDKDDNGSQSPINWDIVQFSAKLPFNARAANCILSCSVASTPCYCLLRSWCIDKGTGVAVYASRSVRHNMVDEITSEVLPSGWVLRERAEANNGQGGVEINYIAEHDLNQLRQVGRFLSDKFIINTVASTTNTWLNNLNSLIYE